MRQRPFFRRTSSAAIIVIGAVGLTGCARTGPRTTSGNAASPIPLRVDNRYRADVVIFVARAGDDVRFRLGTVNAARSASLLIPARFVGEPAGVQLIADPVGGTPLRSERITVVAGSRVEWTLESGLQRSMIAVY
jgi:hypothetical protein